MRVTEKGQVTIPHNIRLQLGIEPGSQVECIAAGDHAIVRKIANTKEWAERFMKYKGSAKTSMSTEEILNLTRRE